MVRPRRKRRRRQRGGKVPWVVVPKKAYEVTQDMIKALKKPVSVKQANERLLATKVSISSTKEEAEPRDSTVGPSTRGTPRGTRRVAANNGATQNQRTTTTTTSNAPCCRKSRVSVESGGHLRGQTGARANGIKEWELKG